MSRLAGVSALIPLPGEEFSVKLTPAQQLALRCERLEELLRRAALWIDAFDVRSPKGRRPDKLLADIAAALKGE